MNKYIIALSLLVVHMGYGLTAIDDYGAQDHARLAQERQQKVNALVQGYRSSFQSWKTPEIEPNAVHEEKHSVTKTVKRYYQPKAPLYAPQTPVYAYTPAKTRTVSSQKSQLQNYDLPIAPLGANEPETATISY
jgi:hypothetical protein